MELAFKVSPSVVQAKCLPLPLCCQFGFGVSKLLMFLIVSDVKGDFRVEKSEGFAKIVTLRRMGPHSRYADHIRCADLENHFSHMFQLYEILASAGEKPTTGAISNSVFGTASPIYVVTFLEFKASLDKRATQTPPKGFLGKAINYESSRIGPC